MELWQSDGATAGTTPVSGGMSYPQYLTNVNGTLFFAAGSPPSGPASGTATELWMVSPPPTIDLTVSLYKNASTPAERAPYERILEFFADGIYEMSNGTHRVGTVTIFPNGGQADTANVLWNASEWPRAHTAGYGQPGAQVFMGDQFPFDIPPYNALTEANWRGAGYSLAHEWGHYYWVICHAYSHFYQRK